MAVKLSIIIPVYCVEATLDRCLQSIVAQSFTDFEVLLVDDGSPDGCPQLCEAWGRRDSRIRVSHRRNGGLSAARNAGLDMAQGDFVTFVDSDDFLATDTYAQVMPLAETADIVEYPILWHHGTAEATLRQATAGSYADAADYWLRGHAYEHTYVCNKVFRRTLFDGVRFPVGRVFEDAWTLPLLLRHARRIVGTAAGCYYYCYNAQGITARAGGDALAMLLDAHRQAMALWCDDRYYMHVVDILLDVHRLTGRHPHLPPRRIAPWAPGLTWRQRLKAIVINLTGINTLCHIHRLTH